MKIVFVPSRQQWYIEKNLGWYLLEREEDVELVLSVLPLRVDDEYSQIDQRSFSGTAHVSLHLETLRLETKDVVGTTIEVIELLIDEKCLCCLLYTSDAADE